MANPSDFTYEVKVCDAARIPVVWFVTHEEMRAEVELAKNIKAQGGSMWVWSLTSNGGLPGWEVPVEMPKDIKCPFNEKLQGDPSMAVRSVIDYALKISSENEVGSLSKEERKSLRTFVIFRDPHAFLDTEKSFVRMLRDANRELKNTLVTIICISPTDNLPTDLKIDVNVIRPGLPKREAIRNLIVKHLLPDFGISNFPKTDELIEACLGLTLSQASDAVARNISTQGTIDPAFVYSIKTEHISSIPGLTFEKIRPDMSNVGGLAGLKLWISKRKRGFTKEASSFGLPAPKGVLTIGVQGCLHGETLIHDPVDQSTQTIKRRWEIGKPFYVTSLDVERNRITLGTALPPQKFGKEKMLRISFDNGRSITVTPSHRFWTGKDWISASEVFGQTLKSVPVLLKTNSEPFQITPALDVLHSIDKEKDSPNDYRHGLHLNDAQLPSKKDTCKEISPSQVDALSHNPGYSRKDDPDRKLECIHSYQELGHLSKPDSSHQKDLDVTEFQNVLGKQTPDPEKCLVALKSPSDSGHSDRDSQQEDRDLLSRHVSYIDSSSTQYTKVVSIHEEELDEYYDFHVPVYNNYWCEGVFNHNCGKSLFAKAVAAELNVPLIRLNPHDIKQGVVGATEENLRRVKDAIESIGQCVIWIDELEKSLPKAGEHNVDGGTSDALLGGFLHWFQERPPGAFVVATANDISALPPELLRKGRWDDIFFVDLPTLSERIEIIKIHLSKRGKKLTDQAILKIARDTDGFSGAELESAIIDGMWSAFSEEREVIVEDIIQCAKESIPLSEMMKDQIRSLRDWAKNAARNASVIPEKNKDEETNSAVSFPIKKRNVVLLDKLEEVSDEHK